ncbi:MAG: DUF4886 domain-containing protein [Muribaculaceae bacterium]|nr:DUF4886 domain-containing protein [Muribaculaceae bacterium]
MKKLLFLVAAFPALLSCTNQESLSMPDKNAISFNVHVGKTTRAGDVTNTNLQNFYIYGGYNSEAQLFNGDAVSKTAQGWSTAEPKYWVAGQTYNFAAVAPEAVNASYDLSQLTISSYSPEDNDLVVALTAPVEAKPVNDPVSLNFRHALSKVKVTFNFDESIKDKDIEISDVKLSNVVTKGNLTASFNNGTEISWTDNNEKGEYEYTLSGDYSGVKYLLPQQLGNDISISFSLTTSGSNSVPLDDSYRINLKTDNVNEWEIGHAYNYIIDLNSLIGLQEIRFTVEDIAGWENEDYEGEDPDPTPEPEPTPGERDPMADGKLCILAIGNSFSQDAVEQYLYDLFDAAGIEVVIGNLYIGGCRLDTHWSNAQSGNGAYEYRKVVNGVKNQTNNVSLTQGLADEDWDIITLQQASGSSGQYETYTPYLENLIEWVAERSDADIWFHQTWAYAKNSDHAEFPKYNKDQITMYNAIMDATQKAMADNPQLKGVIPSGTAIQNGRTSFLGDSFNRDGYHLETTYGRYTAACTWFEALTGINVVGNTYAPSTVNAVQKEIAQNAAHLAVLKPYEITEMTEFAKPDVSGPLTSSLLIDFGGNKGDNSWNFIGEIDATEVPLTDAEGNYTSVTLSIEKPFTSSFNGAGSEPKEDNDIISGGITWPLKSWADSFVISGPVGTDSEEAVITINGLDLSKTYNVTVLSARWNGSREARETKFELVSDNGNESAQIYQGIGRNDFNWTTFNFEDISYTFENAAPNADGSLQLKVIGLEVGSTVVEGNISAMCISPN